MKTRLRESQGQSTVEFALVLPLVMFLMVALIQLGLVMRDHLLVVNAAREAAREAAVTPDASRVEAAARRAAPGLELGLDLSRGRHRGDLARVTVSARPTRLPLVGTMVGGTRLSSTATMRVERES